ncbi:MAG: 50S ribosomal protein L24 [Eubacteriaceae bacterium]|nr:50S ribosomal protein L24 [Eubacteriaceae bacterium]
MHVRRDDTVVVIAGVKDKDKGKRGKIIKVFPKTQRVIVEGVNMRKKHLKPTNEMRQAGIIDIEGSLHISNVQLYCPKCRRGVRTGHKIGSDGKKVRFCRKCGETFGGE